MKNLKFLKNITNREQLKKEYHKLCRQYHPDLNRGKDTTKDMQEINEEYEFLMKRLPKDDREAKKQAENSTPNHENTVSADDIKLEATLQQIIYQLVTLDGVIVEICGTWLWLSGNTKEHKEKIKELGFKWASKKKMWFFGTTKSTNRREMSMDEIRSLHGSTVVKAGNGSTVLSSASRKALA